MSDPHTPRGRPPVEIPGVRVPNRVGPREAPSAELPAAEVARIERLARAPKKWADREQSQITAEWLVWHNAQTRRRDEEKRRFLRHGPFNEQSDWANEAIYFPEEYDKVLPEGGGWILVIDPPTAVALDFKVPLLSMWFARPHALNAGRFAGRAPYQAIIQTPAGDLHLWPHEFSVVSDPSALIGEDGAHLHRLGGEPVLDEDKMFYLRSRGISRHEATLLLFAEINQPNYCYVTFPDEIVEVFAGVGTRTGSTARADFLSEQATHP